MKHTNKNTRLAAIKWWKSLDNFSRNEVISKYVRGAKFLGRTLSSLTGRECEELYLSMTPATPSPLPETGKKVITRNGEVLPMNEAETEVFHFGTWKEIQEDQDGELYIMGGLNAIYIDYLMPVQKPLPETETGVSIDTPTEAEMYSDVWEWEDAQKKKPAPLTPGNERQEGDNWEVQHDTVNDFIFTMGGTGKRIPIACTYSGEVGREQAKENARLICQSKAMYRALKKWLEVINRSPAALHHYGEAISETEAILKSI